MFRRRGSSQQQQNPEHHHEQQPEAKVNELRAALGPLSGRNLIYCTDACLKRYLEARNWNVDKAKKMLEETLIWRSTYKPEEIRWQEVAVEGETGKLFRANFRDRFGRSILIMKPGLQNTTSMDTQIRHLVYMMENAILNLPDGQEEMIVKYFLDPKTFQKVKFVYPKNKESLELMKSFFDVDNLPTEFGGKATMNYDHQDFSKLMAQDDVKAAKFWRFDEKMAATTGNHIAGAAVAPDPESVT